MRQGYCPPRVWGSKHAAALGSILDLAVAMSPMAEGIGFGPEVHTGGYCSQQHLGDCVKLWSDVEMESIERLESQKKTRGP
eukprot:CAMPEP_0177578674 /NCGR_PEP_ID=MMETSP0419_2-20121207/484_1 /TAXON_ID=582737 /ORGANISM="Tetraselmis sp., Strain GSL018" /LENGTH=80 /DNA_ID=CAMNT_0019067153 /DNA_START=712 /DNA_END=954 /DNA_ORIENTATION=-